MDQRRQQAFWLQGLQIYDVDAIEQIFKELLADLPMPQSELAKRVGVAHTTVGRWARGETRASLDHMIRAVDVIAERLDHLKHRADLNKSVLQAALAARDAWNSGKLDEAQLALKRLEELVGRQGKP